MAMDAAAVQALVAAAVKEAMTAMQGAQGGGGGGKASNIHKFYTRVDKLSGEDWKEWHHQFSVATFAYDQKNGALLEIVEQKELDEVTTATLELELTQSEANWMHHTKSELFSVLTLLTKGEANKLVRSCEDLNGYTAWKKLYDRFNPKTPASLTAAWRDVVRPQKIKDMRQAGKAIDAWESKLVLLKREHGEEPTLGLKASLVLEMLPESVQLTVAQGMSSRKLDYDLLKAKIKLMANIQMDYSTPKPMEIGEMNDGQNRGWEEEDWDYGVDAVGAQKGKGRGRCLGHAGLVVVPTLPVSALEVAARGRRATARATGPARARGSYQPRCMAHAGIAEEHMSRAIARRMTPGPREARLVARARGRARRCVKLRRMTWVSRRRLAASLSVGTSSGWRYVEDRGRECGDDGGGMYGSRWRRATGLRCWRRSTRRATGT